MTCTTVRFGDFNHIETALGTLSSSGECAKGYILLLAWFIIESGEEVLV